MIHAILPYFKGLIFQVTHVPIPQSTYELPTAKETWHHRYWHGWWTVSSLFGQRRQTQSEWNIGNISPQATKGTQVAFNYHLFCWFCFPQARKITQHHKQSTQYCPQSHKNPSRDLPYDGAAILSRSDSNFRTTSQRGSTPSQPEWICAGWLCCETNDLDWPQLGSLQNTRVSAIHWAILCRFWCVIFQGDRDSTWKIECNWDIPRRLAV